MLLNSSCDLPKILLKWHAL